MSSESIPELTSEQFKTRFPEFVSIHDELIIANLESAKIMILYKAWKQYYLEAIGLLAAHEITLRQNEQLITEMRVAMIRGNKPFSETQPNSYYRMTSYGHRFLELKKKIIVTGFTI